VPYLNRVKLRMSTKQLSIAITGAGGAGVISCGELLLQAWGRLGGRGLLRKAYGPQIRGGESAALLKLTEDERYTAASLYDVVFALDWDNFSRFEDEIRLGPNTRVICDQSGAVPGEVLATGAEIITLPLAELAAGAHADGRVNMLALGILGGLLGLPTASLGELADQNCRARPQLIAQRQQAVLSWALPSNWIANYHYQRQVARGAGISVATRQRVWVRCRRVFALWPLTRLRLPPMCWNGWPGGWNRWVVTWCRRRMSWRRST
jgi:Pyruvate/2-oxoacid:ferredoxin oxidoreductase gamma subunit